MDGLLLDRHPSVLRLAQHERMAGLVRSCCRHLGSFSLLVVLAVISASALFAGEGKMLVKGDPEAIPVGHVKFFRPGAVWPDNNGVHINAHGGGMISVNAEGFTPVVGKKTYWFGEHKIEGDAGNVAQVGVHCYSSSDLYNWKDEGIALAVSDDPESDIIKGCVLERPKVIYNKKTRKYVMWFHLELKDQGYTAARTGVAVSDKVTGPYKFIESFRPDGQESRDMTVYVDDDEKAYLLHSSENNATLHISLLTDDYLKPAGMFERVFEGRFMEAPVVFKCKDKYYFIASDCTGWAPNAARSAVADKITGPWTELGNPCIGTVEQCSVTFTSQSTYVLPVPGKKDAFIFMADRWRPENAIDGRYIWLPVEFENGRPVIRWVDQWDLGIWER